MTSPAPTAEAVLTHLAKSVVTDPEAVQINVEEDDDLVRMDVSVGDDDMGRIIGRRGRVATAIRTVVNAAASKDEVKTKVEFVE